MSARSDLNAARKAEREGRKKEAAQIYKTIIETYPNSQEAKVAKIDLTELIKSVKANNNTKMESSQPVFKPVDYSCQSDSRICEFCNKTIEAKSVKCPHCQEWITGVQRDRQLMYFWSIIGSSVGGLLSFYGIKEGWWIEGMQSPWNKHPFVGWSWHKFFGSASGIFVITWSAVTYFVAMFYGNRYSKISGKQF